VADVLPLSLSLLHPDHVPEDNNFSFSPRYVDFVGQTLKSVAELADLPRAQVRNATDPPTPAVTHSSSSRPCPCEALPRPLLPRRMSLLLGPLTPLRPLRTRRVCAVHRRCTRGRASRCPPRWCRPRARARPTTRPSRSTWRSTGCRSYSVNVITARLGRGAGTRRERLRRERLTYMVGGSQTPIDIHTQHTTRALRRRYNLVRLFPFTWLPTRRREGDTPPGVTRAQGRARTRGWCIFFTYIR